MIKQKQIDLKEKKLSLRKNDILILETGEGSFRQDVMAGIHQEIKKRYKWDGVILIVKKGETVQQMGDHAQKQLYEHLRSRFDTPKLKMPGRLERRRFNFRMWFDKITGHIGAIPVTDSRGRVAGNGLIIGNDEGELPRPSGPGDWLDCQAEVIIYVEPNKRPGEVTIQKKRS